MNRRLAEHRERRPGSPSEASAASTAQSISASRRAQEAAARVAARYAKAPSYSEVLATEARAALRAAEAATEAALQARAAAESVLANIEAAAAAPPEPIPAPQPIISTEPFLLEPVVVKQTQQSSPALEPIAEPGRTQVMENRAQDAQPLSIRWAPELPVWPISSAEIHEGKGQLLTEEDWWRPASAEPIAPGVGEVDIVDPALPIHGNLIEFPRELIAARKVRPRLAELSNHDAANMQLSIFEVDPDLVSTAPSVDAVEVSAAAWTQPAWSGMELDAQPQLEYYEELREEPAALPHAAHPLHPASLARRVMAMALDGTLIGGALVCAAAFLLHHSEVLPSVRAMEQFSAGVLLLISAIYITLFYAIAPVTPGMKYAGIRFCTFEGHAPTPAQRWHRLGAMLLSVLPAGLGFAWSLFDEDNLSWHDRLSKTYITNQ